MSLTPAAQPVAVADDAVVMLIYELLSRGAVSEAVLPTIIRQVRATGTLVQNAHDAATLDRARDLARQLPWYGGA